MTDRVTNDLPAAAIQVTQIVEIRARRDRNRLLATYDPALEVLRFFHRGEIITVSLEELGALDTPNVEGIDIS